MATGLSKTAVKSNRPVERSVCVWPQQPAQIHPDAESIAVELQRHTAARVELEIEIADRFVINSGVEAVVTHEIGGARGNTGAREVLAVGRLATSGTLRRRTAAENAADTV